MSIPLNKPEVIATAENVSVAQMNFGGLETASGKAVSFILLLSDTDGKTVDTISTTLVGDDYNDFWNNSFNTNKEILTFLKERTGLDFPVNDQDAEASFLNEPKPEVVEEEINPNLI